MEEPIIRITGLTKHFGGGENEVAALENINIEIRRGEIFGVIGLSGAGKSTLVRCINLLERPTSGSVVVDGKEMTALNPKELRQARKSIGMIFQGFNLLMQRTALHEQVELLKNHAHGAPRLAQRGFGQTAEVPAFKKDAAARGALQHVDAAHQG